MLVRGPPASPWSRRWRQPRKRSSPRLHRLNPTSPRVDRPAPVSRSSRLDFVAHFVGAVALLAGATCRRHRNRVVSACLRGERGERSPGWLVRRGCPGPPDPSPEPAGAGSSRMTSGTTSRRCARKVPVVPMAARFMGDRDGEGPAQSPGLGSVERSTWAGCTHEWPRASRSSTSPAVASGQWRVSWLWHISTNVAMRAARVPGFFASLTR